MAFYDDLSLLTVTLHFDETAIDSSAFLVREPETGEDVASTNIPSIVCAKIGYTLTGWKRTATEFAGKSQDGEFAVEDVASAFSVFGEWDWDEETEDEVWRGYVVKPIMTANGYTVTFNANGGVGAMPGQSFVYDVEQALNKNAFHARRQLAGRDRVTWVGIADVKAGSRFRKGPAATFFAKDVDGA